MLYKPLSCSIISAAHSNLVVMQPPSFPFRDHKKGNRFENLELGFQYAFLFLYGRAFFICPYFLRREPQKTFIYILVKVVTITVFCERL
jgi:hypothetical protein